MALVLLFGVFFVYTKNVSQTALKNITVGGVPLLVEVVLTEPARERGLSGRPSLPQGEGMLFVFEKPGSWGIWMKDMQFPLDIIWVRADGVVSTIEKDVPPSSYPTAFYPKTPDVLYVVEVQAGWAQAHGVAEGSSVVIQ